MVLYFLFRSLDISWYFLACFSVLLQQTILAGFAQQWLQDYRGRIILKKQVVIVNGAPGVGKTTVSNIIAEKYPSQIRSSIDLVKEVASKYFGWTGEKTNQSRQFLSDMKHFLTSNTNMIESDLELTYKNFIVSDNDYLLIDIREPEEIAIYKQKFDATTLLVKNERVQNHYTNYSDSSVLNYEYDYVLSNNLGLIELEEEINKFLSHLNKKNK